MGDAGVSRAILELSRRHEAIPIVEEFWCLSTMAPDELCAEEDGKLLQLMIAGEEHGFVALYNKYQSHVYRFAFQVSGVRHIAEDVTQDTFLALIRAPHKYRDERGSLLLYLFGIARNLVWKSIRREKLYGSIADDQDFPGDCVRDLAEDLVRKEQAMRVRHAILSLPRKYREVIVLCAFQELSYEQAARLMGSSIGTVRSRMHRAKRLLIRKLRERGPAPETPSGNSMLRCGV
jgi:RNA polymerase sigma-70 factor, ECF subfamily